MDTQKCDKKVKKVDRLRLCNCFEVVDDENQGGYTIDGEDS